MPHLSHSCTLLHIGSFRETFFSCKLLWPIILNLSFCKFPHEQNIPLVFPRFLSSPHTSCSGSAQALQQSCPSLSQQPCLHALCFTIPAAAPLCSHSLWSFHCVFSISVCLSYSSSMEGCPHTPSWDCRGCRAQWLDEDLPPHVRLNSVLLLPLGRALVPQHPLPRATAARTPSPWRLVLSLITHWAFLLYNK